MLLQRSEIAGIGVYGAVIGERIEIRLMAIEIRVIGVSVVAGKMPSWPEG